MDNRPEPRVESDLIIRIWGMGADGRPFFQNIRAHNISSDGALFSGLEHQLNAGDVIGTQLGDKKARCRVVWVIDAGTLQKIQIGVQLLENQECPWKQQVSASAAGAGNASNPGTGRDKRRFYRHKIGYPLELRDERSGSSMQTSTTDISGRGCYVETMLPLPLGTSLTISFWMENEKISTSGVVRAADPGFGMGIEFTGLDLLTQQRLQQLLEKMDPTFASVSKPQSHSGV